ncbi:hypothetical protein AB6N24_14980 [Cellulomonas sp. 179-A 4D5 NHS]|uniref:hypothetical protein n=1 Tax=Cellulomonas sp. 179-A 4D5 NHS TaxID=3142378 RepID=UPI0039A2DED2
MSQVVAERPIKLRSRAKVRAGLEVVQDEARSQRRAIDRAVDHVLTQLAAAEDGMRLSSVIEDAVSAGHSRRRATDAVYRLEAVGRVSIDPTSSTVALIPVR